MTFPRICASAFALVAASTSGAGAGAAAGGANDGATHGTRAEVWRISGRLEDPSGHAFDYSASFFRFASARGPAVYPATVSIVDESTGRRIAERRTERDGFGLATASTARLAMHVGDWSLAETSAPRHAPSFALDVRLAGGALHVRGVAKKARIAFPDEDKNAFAYTSIGTTASLELGAERFAVTGKSWLDHETGDGAAPPDTTRIGRFCVQLDDGREILVETSQPAPGAFEDRQAFLVKRDGTIETLAHSRYEFANHLETTWLSTHTRVRYPDLWSLHVESETPRLALEPVKLDQESIAAGDGMSFYDGAVDVYDVTPDSQGLRLGSGFVTLAGYRASESDL